ncbi:MAG: alpha/beta hydrolase, partial [Pseudomonadota bacterium]
MTTRHLLDPEILPALDAFPDISLEKEMLPMIRQAAAQLAELADANARGVVREEVIVPGRTPDDPSVRCLLYKPQDLSELAGAYLHLHGGGYILGSPEGSDLHNIQLAASLGIVIISV